MAVEELPEIVTVVLLACVLAVFLYRLATPRRKRQDRVLDFGTAFSVFIGGWVATEILAISLPSDWSGVSDVLHLVVAVGLAVWINVRWRWSLRLAQVSP
ncbi:MAG TPA: hypothetical protein VEM77_09840 [Thermoplasmata archaeon]|nr:hypothetical protein [Thermoplasmata archaeon]